MSEHAPTARLTTDVDLEIGPVDERLFGSFVEHMGRCVYDGIHNPDHATADADGFRADVAEQVRELGPTVLRYPGGNFVSGYHWEDGVGPRQQRPSSLDLAWRSTETNQAGTDEFVRWSRAVGAEPMLAVNLGTRGVDAALGLLEYCNHPGGSRWSDLRRAHGTRDPHDVRVWCLGNEMDGPWQLGHRTAFEYGRIAAQTAAAMRRFDPALELVACGTSKPNMPTFAEWEATVLEQCYHLVDHLSVHMYVDPDRAPGRSDLLAAGLDVDDHLDAVIATTDHVRAKGRHRKRMTLAFDEWNVWYNSRRRDFGDWPVGPRLIEDTYTLTDGIVTGSFLMTLLRRADRVKIACLAQLVNVIAPIRTEPGGGPVWRQPSFYPFALTNRHGRGTVLRSGIRCGRHDTASRQDVADLDAVPVWHPDTGELTMFAVNRDQVRSLPLEMSISGVPGLGPGARVAHTTLTGPDPDATNSAEHPRAVVPVELPDTRVERDSPTVALPPLSWNMLRITPS